jgi:drug/metabolite transporter (DMT)-like permease
MVIITGILTVGLNTGKGSARALLLSLAVGFFTGCYTSLDRWAIEYVTVYSLLFWKFTVAGVILLAAGIRDRSFAGAVRENFVMSALTGMFILAAYFLVVLAMKHSNLGYVAAGRESGIAFSTLFGYVILREKVKARGLAGIVTLFLGIVLLRFA